MPSGLIDPRPDFFLVGAPKSGTSALYSYLRQHPDVFMPEFKEPHFFGSDHERLNHERFTQEQYLGLFAAAYHGQRVGEGSTSYLHSRSAAREISAFSPDARIIAILRQPVEVMYAYHSEQLVGGFEFVTDFEEALASEEPRKRGIGLPWLRAGIRENLYYREVVNYAPQVERYLEAFGPARVRVFLFEDFVLRTSEVFRETLEFLGLDTSFSPSFEVVNSNRNVRSPWLHRLLLTPPESLRKPVRVILPAKVRDDLRVRASTLNTTLAPRPPLQPALRARLLDELRPGIERLAALLDRDLSAWTTPVLSLIHI